MRGKKVKRKSVATRQSGKRNARRAKVGTEQNSREGKDKMGEFKAAEQKLNEGRTGRFALDDAGHFLVVNYRPPLPNEDQPPGRTRVVQFTSDLLDISELEEEAIRNLYVAAPALRSGAIEPELANWVADALEELVYRADRPNPDWNAREAFVGIAKIKGRPEEAPWKKLFMALDIEFARAGGSTIAASIEAVGEFWRSGYDVVEKAHKLWGKTSRRIVSTLVREDEIAGITLASSIADHVQGLRAWRDSLIGTKPEDFVP
jgi:hypothetical protein